MRLRTNINPLNEIHGRTMREVSFIIPAGTDLATLPAALEAAVPGLVLEARDAASEPNGCVNTGGLPDGSRYVSVLLYDEECADPDCQHHNVDGAPIGDTRPLRVAPQLTPSRLAALERAIPEHPQRKLTGSDRDDAMLESLGIPAHHPARRGV